MVNVRLEQSMLVKRNRLKMRALKLYRCLVVWISCTTMQEYLLSNQLQAILIMRIAAWQYTYSTIVPPFVSFLGVISLKLKSIDRCFEPQFYLTSIKDTSRTFPGFAWCSRIVNPDFILLVLNTLVATTLSINYTIQCDNSP